MWGNRLFQDKLLWNYRDPRSFQIGNLQESLDLENECEERNTWLFHIYIRVEEVEGCSLGSLKVYAGYDIDSWRRPRWVGFIKRTSYAFKFLQYKSYSSCTPPRVDVISSVSLKRSLLAHYWMHNFCKGGYIKFVIEKYV